MAKTINIVYRSQLLTFFTLAFYRLPAQVEQLYTPNQVSAATVLCGSNNVPVYGFAFNSTTFSNPVFTALNNFVTTGTYTASDITNFKLYVTNFSVFNTTTLLATSTTSLGPGSGHSFTGFSYTITPSPVVRYFWITVDIKPTAVSGHTIVVSPLTIAMTTITGSETAGTITTGGTQTISCTLPIELTSFSGQTKLHQNVLEWVTASETNNAFFTLEKSTDGFNFTELNTINAMGNSNMPLSYSSVDPSPFELTYYRLKQTDFDGSFTYSETIAVRTREEEFTIYPNPAIDRLCIKNGRGTYRIINAAGIIVLNGSLTEKTELNISALEQGFYTVVSEGNVQKLQVTR
ncbi:MAG TPA: T9SS type A sorting domain-containing protein [Flavobacteriales bacterium]|nr:T9SS type A sorting domain-containing protein [Flavobacteriales bacterium]